MKQRTIQFVIMSLLLVGCVGSKESFKKRLSETLKEDPSVLTDAIEHNPSAFVLAFQKAARSAQSELAKKREQEEQQKLEQYFAQPLAPALHSDVARRGPKDAPLVVVEYSDFECPFCSRSFETVEQLREKYGDKIQLIFKHLPLDFHPQAMISAQYFEALNKQNPQIAWKFHDEIFKNQSKLKRGEPYLKSISKKFGADMQQLAKDIRSKEVQERIKQDIDEAAKFGFQGTPGFLINGIPVKGAYPLDHFLKIIEELKHRQKVKL